MHLGTFADNNNQPRDKIEQERRQSFLITAKRLAQAFAAGSETFPEMLEEAPYLREILEENSYDPDQEMRFLVVGGYAIELLTYTTGLAPLARQPKDIDIIIPDRFQLIYLQMTGNYKLREGYDSASDIQAWPELMSTSQIVYSAEDKLSHSYVPVDLFILKADNDRWHKPNFEIVVDGVKFEVIHPREQLDLLLSFYDDHKDSERYQNSITGRMHSDEQKIARLRQICEKLGV